MTRDLMYRLEAAFDLESSETRVLAASGGLAWTSATGSISMCLFSRPCRVTVASTAYSGTFTLSGGRLLLLCDAAECRFEPACPDDPRAPACQRGRSGDDTPDAQDPTVVTAIAAFRPDAWPELVRRLPARARTAHVPRVFELAVAIETERAMRAAGWRIATRYAWGQLLVEMARLCASAQDPARAAVEPRLLELTRHIDLEPGLPWTVDAMARRVGMSRSNFTSRFRRAFGVTPLQHVTDRRMRRACSLLAETGVVHSEIARHVGYASEAAFSRAFKRWAGVAPGSHRRGERGHRLSRAGESGDHARRCAGGALLAHPFGDGCDSPG